jgi:hypothetical protein
MLSLILLLTGSAVASSPDRARVSQLSESYNLRRGQVRRFYDGISVARASSALIGAGSFRGFRYDCSGMVNAAYASVGIDLEGRSSASLLKLARERNVFHRRKTPRPGDIAFFDNTWDKNGNRRLDDRLTHVAVVEKVDDDGTITLIHKGGRGVTRTMMNLRHPATHKDDSGKVLNSHLRSRSSRDRRRTKYLTGQLWRGFASLWKG